MVTPQGPSNTQAQTPVSAPPHGKGTLHMARPSLLGGASGAPAVDTEEHSGEGSLRLATARRGGDKRQPWNDVVCLEA